MKENISIHELRLWRKEAEQTYHHAATSKNTKRLAVTSYGVFRVYLNGRCVLETAFDVEVVNKYNEIKI